MCSCECHKRNNATKTSNTCEYLLSNPPIPICKKLKEENEKLKAEIEELKTNNSVSPSKLEWQPAETAPDDELPIIAFFKKHDFPTIASISNSPLLNYAYKKEDLIYWLPLSALPPIPEENAPKPKIGLNEKGAEIKLESHFCKEEIELIKNAFKYGHSYNAPEEKTKWAPTVGKFAKSRDKRKYFVLAITPWEVPHTQPLIVLDENGDPSIYNLDGSYLLADQGESDYDLIADWTAEDERQLQAKLEREKQ